MSGRGRRKVDPTDDWELLLPLFTWPEQEAYEELRPLVLFGSSVPERAGETGTPERTMYRRVERFEKDGMTSLFATGPAAARAKRRGLEPAIRRMIVELKAEHPKFNENEISNIVYVRTGKRLGKHTVARVLSQEVVPLKLSRLFEPYHETEDVREAREAVVALHLDGWSVKAVASYLKVSRTTVYRVLGRWFEGGDAGLEDRASGRPKGVRKMDLSTMHFIRKMQENPELGAFRLHAALEQKRGAGVSARTVGRVMAVHRNLYGLGKPKRSPYQKKEMPFRAKRRHEIWPADVRYVPHSIPGVGNVYVISILENYSRCVLASSVSLTQDTTAFLRVLYSAVERYGPPERLVTDGGGIFRATQAKAVYRALGIGKEEIERRKPYQSYVETTFNIQRRMADHHFAKAKSWEGLVEAHDTWREDYNAQRHWAHEGREDGRHSPEAVLGFYTGLLRYREDDLERAFFSTRFARVLDALGYARFRDWRLYGEEGLAGREAAVWLHPGSLTLEYAGETLSAYRDVELAAGSGKPRSVGGARLFETSYRRNRAQLRLFALEEAGWLKALRLEGYAPRRPRGPMALQGALFSFLEAL
ncbi:MAG: helix-turn-helix domain-containing protein [Actinomycetota bacterium]|nr:helix-turn-helix domain-containing protein [Actinomycetota bacterium]